MASTNTHFSTISVHTTSSGQSRDVLQSFFDFFNSQRFISRLPGKIADTTVFSFLKCLFFFFFFFSFFSFSLFLSLHNQTRKRAKAGTSTKKNKNDFVLCSSLSSDGYHFAPRSTRAAFPVFNHLCLAIIQLSPAREHHVRPQACLLRPRANTSFPNCACREAAWSTIPAASILHCPAPGTGSCSEAGHAGVTGLLRPCPAAMAAGSCLGGYPSANAPPSSPSHAPIHLIRD